MKSKSEKLLDEIKDYHEVKKLKQNGTCNKCTNGDIFNNGKNYSGIFSCNYYKIVEGCKYYESTL